MNDTATIYNLTVSTSYVVKSQSVNAIGKSEISDALIAFTSTSTPPSRPLNLELTKQPTGGAISLNWIPPLDAGGTPITGYSIRQYSMTDIVTNTPSIPYKGELNTNTSAVIYGLTPNTSYFFSVVALTMMSHCFNLNSIQESSRLFVQTTSPTPPSSPSAPVRTKATGGMAELSWDAPLDDGGSRIMYYLLYSLPNNTLLYNGSNTYFQVFGLTAKSSTMFFVTAVSLAGTSPRSSNGQISLPDISQPSAPRTVIPVEATADTIQISWTKPLDSGGSNIIDYSILRDGISIGISNTTTFNDTNLIASTNYTYMIQARNSRSDGAYSDSMTVQTLSPALATAPRNIMSTSTGGLITVQWDSPLSFGGSIYMGTYCILYQNETTVITELFNYAPPCTFLGLKQLSQYNVSIFALNRVGNGTKSLLNVSTTLATHPAAPSAPVVISRDGAFLVVQVEPPLNTGGLPISKLLVYRNNSVIGAVLVNDNTKLYNLTIRGMVSDTIYRLEVSAMTTMEGPRSSAIIYKASGATSPSKIDQIYLISSTTTQLSINWTVPENDGGSSATMLYDVRVSNLINSNTLENLTSTFTTIDGLTADTSYSISILAKNSGGKSDWSSSFAFLTIPLAKGSCSWASESYSTKQSIGSFNITIIRKDGYSGAATYSISQSSTGNIGYTFPTSVVFQDSQTIAILTLRITSTTAYNPNQSITFKLIGDLLNEVGSIPSTIIYVDNEDNAGRFDFITRNITVREDSGQIQIPIQRQLGRSSTVVWAPLDISTSFNGTAINNKEYVIPNQAITFATDVYLMNLTVSIINNQSPKYPLHFFCITLQKISGGGYLNTFGNPVICVYIFNDWTKAVPGYIPNYLSTRATGGMLTLNWQSPIYSGGKNVEIIQYLLNITTSNSWIKTVYTTTNQTNISIGGLTALTTYTIRISAINLVGIGTEQIFTSQTTRATLPGIISNIQRIKSTGGSIQIKINPPEDNGGCMIQNYNVRLLNNSTGQYQQVETVDTRDISLYFVYVPRALSTYILQVQVQNEVGVGNYSNNYSITTTNATLPGPPRQLKSSRQSGGAITLEWLPPLDGGGLPITGYNVYNRKSTSTFPLQFVQHVSKTSLVVGTLYQKTWYDFMVVGINSLGVQALPGVGSIDTGRQSITTSSVINQTLFSTIEMGNYLWIPAETQTSVGTIALQGIFKGESIVEFNMSGLGNASNLFSAITTSLTLPGAPPIPLRLDYSSGSVLRLYLRTPLDTGGTQLNGYRIFVSDIEVTDYEVVEAYDYELGIDGVVLIPGLSPLTNYSISVIATNIKSVCESSTAGEKSIPVMYQTNASSLPHSVPSLDMTTNTGGGIALSWSPPFDRGVGLNDTLYYALYISPSQLNQWTLLKNDSTTEYWVKNLTSETAYDFGIVVATAVGSSGFENMIIKTFKTSGISVPGPPSIPTFLNNTGGSITFSWDPPSDNGGEKVTSYEIEVQGILRTEKTSGTTYSFRGLLAGTTYNIRVMALNLMGKGSPSAYAVFTTAAPSPADPPSSPTITSKSGGAVTLSFTPPLDTGGVATSELTYAIYANGVLVATITHNELMASTSSTSRQLRSVQMDFDDLIYLQSKRRLVESGGVTIGNLNPSTSYTFQVRTVSTAGGVSGGTPQQAASTSVPTKPGTPDVPTLAKATGGMLIITWDPIKDSGGSSITKYILHVIDVDTSIVRTCEGLLYRCTLNPLESSSNFEATLQAVNAFGTSDTSPVLFAATSIDTPPSPPINLVLLDIRDTSMDLKWQPPEDSGGSSITSYTVEVSAGGTIVQSQNIPSETTDIVTYTVGSLSPQTPYSISVRAGTFAYTGDASTQIDFITASQPIQAQQPVVQCVSKSSITLAWPPYPQAVSYTLDRDLGNQVYIGSQTNFNDIGLNSNQIYSYRVKATLVDGTSTMWSWTVTQITSSSSSLDCSNDLVIPIIQNGYENNANMVWTIARPAISTYFTYLNFDSFSFECDHDKILVEEIDVNNARYVLWNGGCRRQNGVQLVSKYPNSKISITLTSDNSVTFDGFTIFVRSIDTSTTSISKSISCPSFNSISCGDNGICNGATGICSCSVGFTGEDCSQRILCRPGDITLPCPDTMGYNNPIILVDGEQGDDIKGTGEMMNVSPFGTASKAVRTLQKAISMSTSLTTIFIYPGKYIQEFNCNLNFNGKNVIIHGLFGTIVTFLECTDGEWNIQQSNLTIIGLTISSFGTKVIPQLNIQSNGIVSIKNSILQNGVSKYGGCISIKNGDLNIIQTKFQNCIATLGGAIYAESSTININDSDFQMNSATENGGAIYLAGNGNLVVSTSSILNNTATYNGGGIYVAGINNRISMDQVTELNQNTATNGGGIAIAGHLITNKLIVSKNNAMKYGGGIYVMTSASWMDEDSTIRLNDAGISGGGLYTESNEFLSLLGTLSIQNTANYGGGMAVENANCIIQGITITECSSRSHGGGVSIMNSELQVIQVQIYKNMALQNGGGVFLSDAQIIGSLDILNTSAMGYGGGVYTTGTSTLESITIESCNAPFGGGIYASNSTSTTIRNVNVNDCSAIHSGGGVFLENTTLISTAFEIHRNFAEIGGGFHLVGSHILGHGSADYILIQNNQARNGGGVSCESNSSLSVVQQANISFNFATNGGGAIYSTCLLHLIDVTIENCTASNIGGGISAMGSIMYHDNVMITKCSASSGGGLSLSQSTIQALTIQSPLLKLIENKASHYGGHIAVFDSSQVVDADLRFGNASNGGGIAAVNASGSCTNCFIRECVATEQGGGIFMSGGTWALTDTSIFDNTALDGGGIYGENVDTSHYHVIIRQNSANIGPGISLGNRARFAGMMNDVKSMIAWNTFLPSEFYYGGNIFVVTGAKGFELSEWVITGGNSTRGGGIYVSDGAQGLIRMCLFEMNNATNEGGGLYGSTGSDISVESSTFKNNYALIGAAIETKGDELAVRIQLSLSNVLVMQNQGVKHGAVTTFYTDLKIIQSQFYNNIAIDGNGGAISMTRSNFDIVSSQFGGNDARNGGGLSMVYSTGDINNCFLSGTGEEIYDTNIHQVDTKAYLGGLIYSGDESTIRIKNSTKLKHARATYGGAIYISHSKLILNDSTIALNQADQFGGGILIDESELSVSSTSIESCDAKYDGGGIYVQKRSKIQMEHSRILENQVTNNGAGLYLSPSNNLANLNNVIFQLNNANNYGSGIFIGRGSLVTLKNSNFIENTALSGGGVYITDTFTSFHNCSFDKNKAKRGGGIVVDRSGQMNASSCLFLQNSADVNGGVILLLLKSKANFINGNFIQNIAKNGAGIYLSGATSLVVFNSTFHENSASLNGGGISAFDTSTLYITHSKFQKNAANDGGGVYLGTTSSIEISTSEFNRNQAYYRGGGLFYYYSSQAYQEDLIVESNTATSGGGVFWLLGAMENRQLFTCIHCTIENNENYNIATDSNSFSIRWWPSHATSGTPLLKLNDIETLTPSNFTENYIDQDIWPSFIVQDYYQQLSLTDNVSFCHIQSTVNESDVLFEPGYPSIASKGIIWFPNSGVIGKAKSSSYYLNLQCEIPFAIDRNQNLNLSITMDTCKPGYYLAENNRCARCGVGDYSVDGLNCYPCPNGGQCNQYVVSVATPKIALEVGVNAPRTQLNYMVYEAQKSVLLNCIPKNWDVDDPCLQYAVKQVGGMENLNENSIIDMNAVMDECAHLKTSIAYQKYWPSQRQFSCLTHFSFYKCDVPGSCPANLVAEKVIGNTSEIICAEGYRGATCSVCQPFYKRTTSGGCATCQQVNSEIRQNINWQNFILPFLAFFFLIFFVIGIRIYLTDGTEIKLIENAQADRKFEEHRIEQQKKNKIQLWIENKIQNYKDKQELKAEEKKKADKSILFGIPPVNVIVGVYLIFGNLKKTYNVQWPDTVNNAMDSTSKFNLDLISVAGLDCIMERTFYFDFIMLFGILGVLFGSLILFYLHGVRSYVKKLDLIPRNCIRCGHPVRESFSRKAYNNLSTLLNEKKRLPSVFKQNIHRWSTLILPEMDKNASLERKLKREFGVSIIKTDILPIFQSHHAEKACPTDDKLSGNLLNRTLRSNLRVWQARIKLRMNYHTYRNKCVKLFMWLLLLLYPNVSQYIIHLFNCQEIGDNYYMVIDKRLVCFNLEWSFYSSLGFIGLGVWVAGIPILFYFIIQRVRTKNIKERMAILKNNRYRHLRKKWTIKMREYYATKNIYIRENEYFNIENDLLYKYMCHMNMTNPVNQLRVGFIYQNYIPDFWWFEVTDLLRKLFMNGLILFVHNNPVLKSVLSITLSMILMIGILYYRPYILWSNNIVSSVTQFQLILTLWVGLVLVLNVESGLNLINENLIVSVMLFINLGAVLLTGYIMFSEAVNNSKKEIAIKTEERNLKIRQIVHRMWRKGYNYALYEIITKEKRNGISIPALLHAVQIKIKEKKKKNEKNQIQDQILSEK